MEKFKVFPAKITKEPPEGVILSHAMKRIYENWGAMDDRQNEFFTNFKYSRITGIGKEVGVTRRDPSKVIKVEDTYYVYYTHRKTKTYPVGMETGNISYEIPTYDWDLSDIYYATSKDGFEWIEQGIAVGRAERGEYGDRSLSTPDVMVWNGKYYLYYQTFTGPFTKEKGDYCDVSMAWAESPNGPWHKTKNPVVPFGLEGEWDEGAIHDPCPIVYKGKIWLFYKGRTIGANYGDDYIIRAIGVAYAENPEGPYVKEKTNPIINSGHETFVFPYKEGIASVLTFDGLEKNTIQYASDGLSYDIKAHIQTPPIAAGVYSPDAFTDNGNASGIRWGLCHMHAPVGDSTEGCYANGESGTKDYDSFIARFDCDIVQGMKRPEFYEYREHNGRYTEETYFQAKQRLSDELKEKIILEEQ